MGFWSHPGKAPTFRALPFRPKSTPPSVTGFREAPQKPARLQGNFLRDNQCLPCDPTGCLLLNTQLGRVTLYNNEASPPLSGLCQIWWVTCRNRPTNHVISNLDPQHSFPVLRINLRTYKTSLLIHPDNTNQTISEFRHSLDESQHITS